ncbi:MAG: glycosyltransferase [Bacteroidia bacterium]|nr:glycosyltransferase [Bacteroidia bacterium]
MNKIIISVTNDLVHDRRMHRTIHTLYEMGFAVWFVGRLQKHSLPYSSNYCSVKRFKCFWNKGPLFYLEFNLRLFFWLFNHKPKLLLSVDSDTLLANTLYSIITSRSLVLDMHEWYSEVPELEGARWKKKIWYVIEHWGIKRSSARYTVNRSIAEVYEKIHGQPFEVVRNIPAVREQKQDIKENRPFTLLYLGVVNKGRGLSEVLEALNQLDDVHLIVAGEGDLITKMKDKCREMGLNSRVQFLGWVDPEDLPELHEHADLGLNILDASSQSYYLSLSNKTFDYIHGELPAIAMNFPEYERLNEAFETSYLLTELNTTSLCDAIRFLQTNDRVYNRLKENCRKARKVYHWNNEKEKLIAIFSGLKIS